MDLETIIGLEIHVQFKTKSKMFCSCDNSGENKPPNTTICPICLGHPGTLPVVNKIAIEWAAKSALAINCQIAPISKFDRKHYYYPDLPKAYQISQLDQPIGQSGYLDIEFSGISKKIRINRLHLEEDAAKLIHSQDGKDSLVDYNRGGTPLAEIVTEPDIATPQEAKLFLQELRLIMRYLEVSDADMEKGHLRCDANISLRPKGEDKLYPKTEIKNLNSFKAVEKAIEYEIERQTGLWEQGNPPKDLTTRGWDEAKSITIEQRVKEESDDYRYFPEPDIPPIHFKTTKTDICGDEKSIAIDINCLALPELPAQKRDRFKEIYKVNDDDVRIITENKDKAAFFENTVSELKEWVSSLKIDSKKEYKLENYEDKLLKLISNWQVNNLFKLLTDKDMTLSRAGVTPENFAELIAMIYENKLNSNAALKILEIMIDKGGDPSSIMDDQNLGQISDTSELENIIKDVIKNNPEVVEKYKAGKTNAIQALVGQVMAQTKGKANPQVVIEILKKSL